MDYELFKSIPIEKRPDLDPVHLVLRSANGEILKVHGQALMSMTLGNEIYEYSVKVVSLGDKTSILGLDFMEGEDCVLRIKQGILEISSQNNRLTLHKQDENKCARIMLSYPVCIPPNHELMVSGKIDRKHRNFDEPVRAVEQAQSFSEKTGLLIARSLVDADDPCKF